ncbi:hypothetical protein [Metabacillus litoralis]|uniref:hypothetical protein n=1 Tax=Metabacillus litoralis TaxID=152268 RepID=UPI001CFE4789|nr:hypothetical protein [Metabacillus litoralis]
MNSFFNKPKGFGEILDHTFRLSKQRFSDFFLILLILVGPIYVIQAIVQLLTGTSFFRETGTGSNWFEQVLSSFEEGAYEYTETAGNLGADIGLIAVSLLSLIFLPVAQAAIILAINHIRKEEEYTVSSVIKGAFSRFWPLIGSSILFFLIVFFMVVIPLVITFMAGFASGVIDPIVGILLGIILFLGFAVGIAYLLTRWSFYFGSVTLKEGSPGFTRSWRLTRKRTWSVIGLYIVFTLITTSISGAIQLSFSVLLGNSVLLGMIVNAVSLFTTLLFYVGFAVIYFDLKIRHDADDLKDLIEEYDEQK